MAWTGPTLKAILLCVVKRCNTLIHPKVCCSAIGPYRKIRTAQGANQNAPFQRGPVQLYNNKHYRNPISDQLEKK